MIRMSKVIPKGTPSSKALLIRSFFEDRVAMVT